MADSAGSAVVEAPANTPAPVGSLESLSEYRARRSEVVDAPSDDAPAVETPATEPVAGEIEPDPASDAGKQLAKKRNSLQARIDEVTRERHQTAAERDAAKAEAAALRAELAALKAGKPAETDNKADAAETQPTAAKPQVADFETIDAYFEALSDWKIEQRDARAAADAKAKQDADAKAKAEESTQTRAKAWIERRDAFAATEPEFESVAMPFLAGLTVGTPIGDAIVDSELGPQIALYLAKDPAEAKRIAGLGWQAQIREIGKIEARLETPAPPELKAPVVSKAPAPVKPPTSGAPAEAAAPDPANISSVAMWRSVRKNYGGQ